MLRLHPTAVLVCLAACATGRDDGAPVPDSLPGSSMGMGVAVDTVAGGFGFQGCGICGPSNGTEFGSELQCRIDL